MPGVDVFVCTADHIFEPPTLVINTVLSVLSYNYPPHKLSVYLSDDGGSEFTFYALLEASRFSKYWIPFCNKFKVEPRSPEVYFAQNIHVHDQVFAEEWFNTKVSFLSLFLVYPIIKPNISGKYILNHSLKFQKIWKL